MDRKILTLTLTMSAAVAVAGALGVSTPAPQIRLVDNSIRIDPAPADPGDGSLADGQVLTPFDVQNPAIGRLDSALLTAVQDAATAAAADGVTMTVTSGWRSTDFQRRLMDDAVRTYGSADIARQYVAPPEVSKHVIGEAVDIGGVGADRWLIANGSRFGLCQIYANELWHFELATDAAGICPALLPNAAG
jgi:D-alanyl-D-alanine carboxypeptidase